jgi:uncharacterized membrane protein YeaQ/YmgE (transglycosylase-associated protein family)
MYAKRFLNQVGETASKDSNTILTESTKGTIVGAAIGGGIGLFFGFSKQKSLLMSGFIGATIGGVLSRIFINKK